MPSSALVSGGATSGGATPSHPACMSIILSNGRSFWLSKTGAPVAFFSLTAPPTWSICAWVTTICLRVSPCLARRSRMSGILSPGSMTIASRVASSPTMVQLHCSAPTGKVSRIMNSLSAKLPQAYKWRHRNVGRIAGENETMAARKEWTEWHLTPRGWEKGATRVHGQGNTWVEEPLDRLLSRVYQELQGDTSPEVKKWSEETFRSKKTAEVGEALKKFGPIPERL